MDSSQVRFGVVGVRRITRGQSAPALLSMEHALLLAAASRELRPAEARSPRGAYDSCSALLRDPDVDAVYIVTHNGLHRELVLEALRCGKHVLCEKPLGCTADECQEMVTTAEATGRLLMEAFMYRYHTAPLLSPNEGLLNARVLNRVAAAAAS